MITKQQALEFIYDLSQKTEVKIDVPRGIISVYEDFKYGAVYHYKFQKEKASLEELVTGFIKSYLDIELLKDIKIPVDVDMLEVGQTYKVHIQENWDHRYFTAKFLGFDEEDTYIVKFENNKPCTKFDFREIYKVNESWIEKNYMNI